MDSRGIGNWQVGRRGVESGALEVSQRSDAPLVTRGHDPKDKLGGPSAGAAARPSSPPAIDPARLEELVARARAPSDQQLRDAVRPVAERVACAVASELPKLAPEHLAPPTAHATKRYVGIDFGRTALLCGAALGAIGAVTGVGYHLAEFGTTVTPQSLSDSWHLVWQTLTTVGYGDVPPKSSLGRAWTHVFGTLGIIATTAEIGLAVSAFAHVSSLKRSGQFRSWFKPWGGASKAKPVIVLGGPSDPQRAATYFRRVLDDLRVHQQFVNQPVVFVNQTFAEEIPEDLQKRGAVVVHGLPTRSDDLQAAGIDRAQAIIVLGGGDNDASALHTVATVRAMRPDPALRVIAEVTLDRPGSDGTSHFDLFRAFGATPVPTFRSTSVFAGEITAPGSVDYYRRMMSPYGDRLELVSDAALLNGRSWREILSLAAPLGAAIAYRDAEGRLHRPSDVDAPLHDLAHVYFAVGADAPRPTTSDLAAAAGVSLSCAPEPPMAPVDQPIVLLNAPDNLRYLAELVDDLRGMPSHEKRPIVVVSEAFPQGLPKELEQRGVRLVAGDGTSEATLSAAGVSAAQSVMIMTPDFDDPKDDSRTFMTALKVKQLLAKQDRPPRVLAEVVRFDRDERADLRMQLGKMGVEVVPAVRGEPILPQALNAMGSVDVLTHYVAPARGLMTRVSVPESASWRELLANLAHLGTPVEWVDARGAEKGPPRDVDGALGAREILLIAHTPSTHPNDKDVAACC